MSQTRVQQSSKPVSLLVLSDPDSPQLKLLSALKGRAEICIGNSLEAVGHAAGDADVLLYWDTSPEVFAEVLPVCRKLRWMHCKNAGIETLLTPDLVAGEFTLTNAAGVYARSLAEFALCGMLYFAKDLPKMTGNQRRKNWEQYPVEELRGKTLAIFGYGGIGRETAKRAKAFDMRVIAVRRSSGKSAGNEYLDEVIAPAEKDRLFDEADYLLVSCALTAETKGAIGPREIGRLRRTSLIVNLARGPVIDESALIAALRDRRIRGAVLDVFDVEPLPAENPLWELPNVLLSPHSADQTATWKDESMELFLENFERFLDGQPLQNICDKRLGY